MKTTKKKKKTKPKAAKPKQDTKPRLRFTHVSHVSAEELAVMPQDIRMLDSNEVEALLGVCKPTISAWMRTGELPFYHLGSATRFKIDDLRRLIDSKRVEYTPRPARVPKYRLPPHMLESTP